MTARPLSAAWIAFLALSLPACRAALDAPDAGAVVPRKMRLGAGERPGEHRKRYTAKNFVGQVELAQMPRGSAYTPGFETERLWSDQDDWEPFVAVDPRAPYVYQLTTRYAWPQPRIAFRRSSDGGATFDLDTLIPDTGNGQHDPQCAVSEDGTIFVVWLDDWDTRLIQSLDHGLTWTPPVDVVIPPPGYTDHGWLAISEDGRDVYVGFNWGASYVSASHDHGQTFAPPVKTSGDNRQWFHSGAAVAPDGTVYIGAVDYRGSLHGRAHINVLRSTDGGATWQTQRVDTSQEAPPCGWADGCYTGFFGPFTGLDVDPSGTILLAYNSGDRDAGTQQIWIRTSRDGVRWSERLRISLPIVAGDNGFPHVAAGPVPGDFRVVWQGDFDAATGSWNTLYRATPNAGVTWGPVRRLSDRPDGAPYKGAAGYQFPYGDYLGAAVDATGVVHAIWGEGFSWDGPGGAWSTRGH